MAASDWLADDEGNLTPEAARAVERLGARAIDQPPPVAQGWRPSPRTILLTLVGFTALNLLIALVPNERERETHSILPVTTPEPPARPTTSRASSRPEPGLAASESHRRTPPSPALPQRSRSALTSAERPTTHASTAQNGVVTASMPGRAGEIFGSLVRLRTRPSLRARIQQTLAPRTTVRVLDQQDGWCKLQLPGGRTGWTFGAYVRGPGHFGLGPAVLTKTLVASTTRLTSGTKVLVERRAGPGKVQLRLPDGTRLIAPDNSLRLVDGDGNGYGHQ